MIKIDSEIHLTDLLDLIDKRNVWYSGNLKVEICHLIADRASDVEDLILKAGKAVSDV